MWYIFAAPLVLLSLYVAWLLAVFLYNFQNPKARQIYECVAKLPGLKRKPIVGNLNDWPKSQKEILRFVKKMADMFDGLYGLFIGPQPYLVIAKGSHVAETLKSSKHSEKSLLYKVLYGWLGTGLLTSGGEKWRRRRKMLTPAFHFDILDRALVTMMKHCETAIEKFTELSDCEDKYVDIWEEVSLLALDIISDAAMGVELNAQYRSPDSMEYVKNRERITELVMERFRKPYLLHDFTYYNFISDGRLHARLEKRLHNFTTDVITSRWKELQENMDEFKQKKRNSFLDLLLLAKEENDLSFEDIREEVDTFMFEGHDTTAAAMSFTLLVLANNPDILKKLQNEVDEMFANVVLNEDNVSNVRSTLLNMPYLDAVVKEVLRMYPSVPSIGREITEDTTIGGYEIIKGIQVIVHIYAIHHDAEYYKDPFTFNPDRWINKEVPIEEHPYCYIPFSAGPRNCIGQKFALLEEKLVIASIVKNFDVVADTTLDDFRVYGQMILRSVNKFNIKFIKR